MPKDIAKEREDEWFVRHEREFLEKIRQERQKRLQEQLQRETQEELERLRQLHWMKCPKCGHDMEAVTLEGIEVDRCTSCEGVYFDRGELETLLLQKQKRRGFFRRLMGLES